MYKGLLVRRHLSLWSLGPVETPSATRAHVPNLTDELSTAKERRLNQFGTAVLVRRGKSSTESVEVFGSTHGAPSKSFDELRV